MKEFENRYYPLKRAFVSCSEKFHRVKPLFGQKFRFSDSEITVWHLTLPGTARTSGKRILFSSDWHWHDSARNRKLLEEYSRLAGEFPADIQILGGDQCDDADTLDKLPEFLKKIASLAPETFAVNGNWEAGKRWLNPEYFAGLYASCGITLLENRSVISGGFRLTGLPDISSINFRYLPEMEKVPELTDILLTHNPDGAVAADRKGFLRNFSLILCGHTHGGQCRLPLLGALYIPSFYHRKFDRGIFCRRGLNLSMLVSSGMGEHRHTKRFNCPPEAVIVEFKKDE